MLPVFCYLSRVDLSALSLSMRANDANLFVSLRHSFMSSHFVYINYINILSKWTEMVNVEIIEHISKVDPSNISQIAIQ